MSAALRKKDDEIAELKVCRLSLSFVCEVPSVQLSGHLGWVTSPFLRARMVAGVLRPHYRLVKPTPAYVHHGCLCCSLVAGFHQCNCPCSVCGVTSPSFA